VRRIVANLDFEEELRATFGGSDGSGGPAGAPSGQPYRPLSGPARRAAAAAGARLAVFARSTVGPGDRLWLPGPLPEGAPAPDGVELEHGPLDDLPPAEETLAWGESPRVAALRRRGGRAAGGARTSGSTGPADLSLPLHESLWTFPTPEPGVVARVTHRRFAFELARERGWTPPGAGFATDPAEVETLARAVSAVSGGPWVAKAPWSAAGRERLFGSAPESAREPDTVRRLEALLERHGSALVEPWVERTADFGCAGRLAPSGARLDTVHGLEVDRRGAFRATVPLPSDFLPLAAAERALLEEAFHAAAEALAAAGYVRPFGVDAFRWRARVRNGRLRSRPAAQTRLLPAHLFHFARGKGGGPPAARDRPDRQ
jgi:hypothetical protein